MPRSQVSKEYRRQGKMTQGQIERRLLDHMKAKGHGPDEWCAGCFNRFGWAFPSMQLIKKHT